MKNLIFKSAFIAFVMVLWFVSFCKLIRISVRLFHVSMNTVYIVLLFLAIFVIMVCFNILRK